MKTTLLFAALLLCLAPVAHAQPPTTSAAKPAMPSNHPPIGTGAHAKAAPSPWSEFAEYRLTVKAPPKGEAGTWKFHTYADPADVMIELDTPAAKGRTQGSLLLVGGSVLATRGFAPERGFELDPLDVAVLNLKILTRLLDVAVPGGPDKLKGRQAISQADAKLPIVASTPSANAKFDAPWSLKGTVERRGDVVAFQLEVETAGGDKQRVRWTFAGEASGSPKGRALDESMKLAGWSAYRIGPGKGAKSGHTTLQFAATALPGPYATLKDLRAAAR